MQITPYAKNAKKHPAKQIQQLADIVREVGWRQPVLVNQEGVIVAGHGRWETYQQNQDLPEPWVIDDAGATVMGEPASTPLTKEQEMAYRLADNKLAETDVDMGLVIEELKELEALGELAPLTGYDMDLTIEPDEADDEVPDVPEEPRSKLGDLYELGEHRVLCGDSTKLEDVERLMDGKKADVVVTDPPYNTGMGGKNTTFDYDWSKQKKNEKARPSHMFDDNFTDEEWATFLYDFFTMYYKYTKGDCAYYVFIDWRRVGDIRGEMEKLMDVKNVIVWDKQVHGLGSDYKSTYELCVVGKKGKPDIQNRYGLDYQDIWRLQRAMGRNKDHATAKPVELLEKPIKHASKADDIVFDLFLGSGSTLIAAEKKGRICYGMELDPKYIDVIVQRYVDYTGNATIKLNGQEIVWNKTPTKSPTKD
jgi:DNA modification methylase